MNDAAATQSSAQSQLLVMQSTMFVGSSLIRSFLADRTAGQYDRLLAESCRPSVCLSVCNAVHCGSMFLAGKFLYPFRHFCCMMYRLAIKRTRWGCQ